MNRLHNFNPGPSALPLEVLEKIQADLVDYKGVGMSLLEMSHRSKEFEKILADTKAGLRRVMGIADTYEIIFVGGGASLQFAMIPMNFLGEGQEADYIITGEWAKKAAKEAKLFGKVNVAGTSEKDFNYIPEQLTFSPEARYVHLTSNNTIFGTQWKKYPTSGNVPLIVDMSSDILSRKVDVNQFAMIYAGAQKNLGPAGVTIAIIRKDMLERVANRPIPTMMQYKTHVEKDSLYNTPPCFPIYVIGLVVEWMEKIGGISKIEEMNAQKAKLLYGTIDAFPDFYRGTVRPDSRSWMNATLRLPSEELEQQFIKKATSLKFHGLKGHRSVGGIRVSMYNAVSLDTIVQLTSFMKDFVANH